MTMSDPTSPENSPPVEDGGATETIVNRSANEFACRNHALTISFGQRAKDNRPIARTLTFGELIQEFSTPDTARGTLTAAEYHALDGGIPAEKARRNREKDGGYFIPCQLTGDGRRCNPNVEALFGINLDFDSGKTIKADLTDRLNGYAHLAYTTYSYREEKQKWRVFIPYLQPIAAAQHALVFSHFQELFQGDIDPHCEAPCQFSYTPSCPPDAADRFQCFHSLGALFDPATLPATSNHHDDADGDRASAPSSTAQSGMLLRLAEALTFISSDERKIWIEFGMAIKHDMGEAGLPAWLTWSGTSPKFELHVALETWASLKNATTGPKITLGSIFYMARERGWIESVGADHLPMYITRINEHYFLAPFGGKTLIFKEGNDPVDGRQTLQAMKIADFKALFTSDFVDTTWTR